MPSQIETDLSLAIGGDAGQGIQSSGSGFAQALAHVGYEVFSVSDYRSRIRGGHNFFQIRLSDRPVYSASDPRHLLVAFTQETVSVHLDHLAEGAVVIYEASWEGAAETIRNHADSLQPLPVPMQEIAESHGSRVMVNTAGLGAAAAVLNVPPAALEWVIGRNFSVKGDTVVEQNRQVMRKAYDTAREQLDESMILVGQPPERQDRQLFLHGNHAFAMGAAAGGCSFVSAYPMTPATSIFEWMTGHAAELGIVTKHAESELAAVTMGIGASHGGARALVPTSGGGFSLMTEALGLAGMTETPLVIALAQRGGPSTGLPTRTEQGDLLFTIHASHGEFPRVVLAPGSIQECFEAGFRAFNLADRYQVPVIVLTDQFLASSYRSLNEDELPFAEVTVDRGQTWTAGALEEWDRSQKEDYRRFRHTESGVSPRVVPGHPDAVYTVTGNEHDETGHIVEEIENRNQMMKKRMGKLEAVKKELHGPRWYGDPESALTLISWGSNYGPAREAVDSLCEQKGNGTVNLLHFSDIWPFPVEAAEKALEQVNQGMIIEQNYSGQFASLLRMQTGYEAERRLNKYDGRAMTREDVMAAVEEGIHVG